MKTRTKYIPFDGGLDLVTNPLNLAPGALLDCINIVQDLTQGYTFFQGYERIDGNKPSGASYWILNFTQGSTEPVGTVVGATSGDSGDVISTTVVNSGSFAGGDAAGYMVLNSGTFQDGENLQVGGSTVAVADGTASENAKTGSDHLTYDHAAADDARPNIASVPGTGTISVFVFNGTQYAWRDGLLYKEPGWTQVTFGKTLYFTSGGTYEPSKGETITGATSGATADIDRIILRSGTWSGGDAAGYFILSNQTGTFQSENLDIGGNIDIGTISGDSSDITLSAGGYFRFITYNFYGAEDYEEIYMVDGVNKAHAFDGSILTPIDTGMADAGYTDNPTHVGVHKDQLWLSFAGGSLQYSSLGKPVVFNALTGAGEVGVGEEVTGIATLRGGSTAVFCRNQTYTLSGTPGTDFTNTRQSRQAGAINKTVQLVAGNVVYLDDRGLTTLAASQKYGDFTMSSLSYAVQPYLDENKNNIACSAVNKSRNQYWLFFNDKTAMCFTFTPETVKGVTMLLLEHQAVSAYSGEDSSGNEIMLIGCEDGYVRELYSGYDFDGVNAEAYLRIPFHHYDAPRNNKHFIAVTIENSADSVYAGTIEFIADFDYGSYKTPVNVPLSDTVQSAGAVWSSTNKWGDFYYDLPIVDDISSFIQGVGYNMSLVVAQSTQWNPPMTIRGAIVEYSLMGRAKI